MVVRLGGDPQHSLAKSDYQFPLDPIKLSYNNGIMAFVYKTKEKRNSIKINKRSPIKKNIKLKVTKLTRNIHNERI